MSYQRSWKNSRLEKGNIRENSCLRTETLTDSKGLGKGKTSGFNQGNIFPSRKSLVSDIPAGGRENRETFFYGVGISYRPARLRRLADYLELIPGLL
jgi:hypothetical protein